MNYRNLYAVTPCFELTSGSDSVKKHSTRSYKRTSNETTCTCKGCTIVIMPSIYLQEVFECNVGEIHGTIEDDAKQRFETHENN